MYLLPTVCLCAAVSGVFRAVFAVCDPAHEAVSAFCGGSAAGMGTDSHRKPVCCLASPPLPALLCADVPAADADFTAQECKCVLGVHPDTEHCRRADTSRQCGGQPDPAAHRSAVCTGNRRKLWKAQKQKNSLPQRRSRILRTVQPMQKALTERMKPRIFSATRPRCTATMPQTAILPSPMPSFIHGWT